MDNVTFDNATNLAWLDWTVSKGQSFDDVTTQFNAGGAYAGWRHATEVEVLSLLKSLGLPTANYPDVTGLTDGGATYSSLADHVGVTLELEVAGAPLLKLSNAIVSNDGGFGTAKAVSAGYGADLNWSTTGSAFLANATTTYPHYGHALVRFTIPEPSTVSSVGLGLLWLLRRRVSS